MDTIILKTLTGQGHSDPKMVHNTPPFQDVFTQQIWNSYLKKLKRYASDTIILKTRSEVKVKVTQGLYVTLRHPKMQPHTKFEIPTSNHMRYAPETIILKKKTRSKIKVNVTKT